MKTITLEDVIRLPVSERIRIVEVIWDSRADCPEAVELTEDQEAELDRRLAALEANPKEGSSRNELRARIPSALRCFGRWP